MHSEVARGETIVVDMILWTVGSFLVIEALSSGIKIVVVSDRRKMLKAN